MVKNACVTGAEDNLHRQKTPRPSYNGRKLQKIEIVFIVVMMAIPILHFCVFWLGTNLKSIMMAFQFDGEWSMINFEDLFLNFKDGADDLAVSVRNTLLFFVKDLLIIPFHLLISYFLYRKVRAYKFIQVILYLPAIISPVAMATMFAQFVGSTGPVVSLLQELGVKEIPNFLGSSEYANWTVMFYTIWLGWGGRMLLFNGALARVPVEILESGRIDGINTFQEIVYLIFPLIWPTTSTLIILQLTELFAAGGPVLLLTGGYYKTSTIAYWIFAKCKFGGEAYYEYVAAAGLFFTVIGVPVILLLRKLIESIPTVEY